MSTVFIATASSKIKSLVIEIKTLSIEEYLEEIKPYLEDVQKISKKCDTWKIQ